MDMGLSAWCRYTPLHAAAAGQQPACCALLLDRDASISSTGAPLESRQGHAEQSAARTPTPTLGASAPCHWLCMAPCSLAVRTPLACTRHAHGMHTAPTSGYVEETALSIACTHGYRDVCTLLVGRGARLHNEHEDEPPAEVGRRPQTRARAHAYAAVRALVPSAHGRGVAGAREARAHRAARRARAARARAQRHARPCQHVASAASVARSWPRGRSRLRLAVTTPRGNRPSASCGLQLWPSALACRRRAYGGGRRGGGRRERLLGRGAAGRGVRASHGGLADSRLARRRSEEIGLTTASTIRAEGDRVAGAVAWARSEGSSGPPSSPKGLRVPCAPYHN